MSGHIHTIPSDALEHNGNTEAVTHIIKASPGRLYELSVFNSSASTTLYVQLHDRTTAPTAALKPKGVPKKILAGATESLAIDGGGVEFSTGIVVAASTTGTTWTDPSTSYITVSARYK